MAELQPGIPPQGHNGTKGSDGCVTFDSPTDGIAVRGRADITARERYLETFLRVAETGYCICIYSSPATRRLVLDSLSPGLAGHGIALLDAEVQDPDTSLLDFVRAKLAAFGTRPAGCKKTAVSVTGLESVLAPADHGSGYLRLRRLNYQWDRLEELGSPLIFWMPGSLTKSLRRHAPEFSAGRSLVIGFAAADEAASSPGTETLCGCRQFRTPEEARRKMKVYREIVQGESNAGVRALFLRNLASLSYALGELGEARDFYCRLLAIQRKFADKTRALTTLYVLAKLAKRQGDFDAARRFYVQSLGFRQKLGDTTGVVPTLKRLSALAEKQGDHAGARELLERCLSAARQRGDSGGAGHALRELAILARARGDSPAARELYEQSLAVNQELNNHAGAAKDLRRLGLLAQDRGDYAAARGLYEKSLAICRELGNKAGIARILYQLAGVTRLLGDCPVARELYGESLVLDRELGDKPGIARALHQLADLARELGDYPTARARFAESIAIKQELGDEFGIAISQGLLGEIYEAEGDDRTALKCYLSAAAVIEGIRSYYKKQFGVRMAAMRQRLGEEAFQKLYDEAIAELNGPTAGGIADGRLGPASGQDRGSKLE